VRYAFADGAKFEMKIKGPRHRFPPRGLSPLPVSPADRAGRIEAASAKLAAVLELSRSGNNLRVHFPPVPRAGGKSSGKIDPSANSK